MADTCLVRDVVVVVDVICLVPSVHAERPERRGEEAAGGGREEDNQRRALVPGPAGAQGQRVGATCQSSWLKTINVNLVSVSPVHVLLFMCNSSEAISET